MNVVRLMSRNEEGTVRIVADVVRQFDPDTDQYAGMPFQPLSNSHIF